jgi:Tfp pilus assembly protein PilE
MVWFLIIVLAVVAVLALLAILGFAVWLSEAAPEDDAARIEWEVRRAERRLHDVASDAFASMLEEARGHSPRR